MLYDYRTNHFTKNEINFDFSVIVPKPIFDFKVYGFFLKTNITILSSELPISDQTSKSCAQGTCTGKINRYVRYLVSRVKRKTMDLVHYYLIGFYRKIDDGETLFKCETLQMITQTEI